MPNRPSNGNGSRRWEPPNSSFRGKVASMKVDRGFDSDPLKPKKHYVLNEVSPGQWEIIGNTGDPIEMLRLEVARDHAVGLQAKNLVIIDEERTIQDSFHNYIPVPQPEGEPIGEENIKIRDRWISSILKFVLPRDLHEFILHPEFRIQIQEELTLKAMAMSVRPDGRAVIIFREDKPLASWAC